MGSNDTASNSRPLNAVERLWSYQTGNDQLSKYRPNGDYPDVQYQGNDRQAAYQDPGALKEAQYQEGPAARQSAFTAAGPGRALNEGDYEDLQQKMIDTQLSALNSQKSLDAKKLDDQMAARGLASSGIMARANNDLSGRYSAAEQAAIGNAVNQRYQLQAQDLNNLNQYQLANAGMANQYNLGQNQMLNSYDQAANQSRNAWGLSASDQINNQMLARAQMGNQFQLANQQAGQAGADSRNAFNLQNAANRWNAAWRPADYQAGLWNGTGGVVSSSTGGGWSI